MSDIRYPEEVRRLNRVLQAELGSNPRYAWCWSEDVRHVMDVIDDQGRPEYVEQLVRVKVTPEQEVPLIVRKNKTAVRHLLPFHKDVWVACALVEVNEKDGSITGTGEAAWIPVSSSRSGPAALPPNVKPNDELTQAIIAVVRAEREKAAHDPLYLNHEYEEGQRKMERERWQYAFEVIREACTALYAVPGVRGGHVSWGGVDATLL